MMNKIYLIGLLFITLNCSAQIKADSVFLFYGMNQVDPEQPLQDYMEHLVTSGAKSQKIKTNDWNKIQSAFDKTKPKKYKETKEKGTVYFLEIYTKGNKEHGVFISTLETGKFINLTSKEINLISKQENADKLYYTLIQIH